MCTAATYQTKNTYFGRNLDYNISYGEEVCITPRNFPFTLRSGGSLESHYALIGIAYVPNEDGTEYPLYYDAVNEKGVGMAGLNFVGNTFYQDPVDGKNNIASFEFIPWILGQCTNLTEVKTLLSRINLTNVAFSSELPPAELHWLITDSSNASIVVESTAHGLKIYDNPIGILTNNPPFEHQLLQLSNYQHLSAKEPVNNLAPKLSLPAYSRGMGAIGLPGDLSSESRFAKAAFTKLNSLSTSDELSSVNQFFHVLHSVEQQYGCCNLGDDQYEHTLYSSCYNLNEGIFYYTTYHNHQISAINLSKSNLEAAILTHQPIINTEQINYLN